MTRDKAMTWNALGLIIAHHVRKLDQAQMAAFRAWVNNDPCDDITADLSAWLKRK